MPVDPYGGGYYYDTIYADENYPPPPGGGGPSILDVIAQGIHEGAQTAQVIGSGYPPGSTIVYSPQYPQGQIVAPPPAPYCGPGGCGGAALVPVPTPAPGGGVNLSNTTLMLLVGGVLLFILGSKRGR